LATLFFALVLCAAFGGTAHASTWNAVKLQDPSVQVALYGVSCHSASLCVAGGGNSTIAVSTNPTGAAGDWRVFRPGGGVDLPDFGIPGGGDPIYGGGQIRGVSCPSTELCVAASFEGSIYSSTEPTGGASAWKVVPLSEEKKPRVHMGGVSCPSPSLCVAVAYAGKVVHSTDPAGDRAAWTVTELGQPFDLRGVSCPSVSLCVAVGNEGTILTSEDPTGGASTWKSAGTPLGDYSMNGISCPSPSLCVTGNPGKIATSTNPAGGASGWNVISAGTGLPVKGVSCPSTSACAAIDNNADVIASTNPTGGQAAWWFKNVLPFGWEGPDEGTGSGQGNGMFGISCPTTSLCAAVGQDSQVITSTDPFVQDVAKRPVRRGGRRPHVVITKHPAKRLNRRKGGVKVTFRFRAIGKAARFKCKTRGRRFRTCKSPMRYRVGGGKHTFRVRAIAPGGAKGPPAAFHFRVGRLTERPPHGSCPSRPPVGPPGLPWSPCIPGG
jgi:hypothetical protein